MFIGMDAITVQFLARKARKLAAQVGRPVHRVHRRDRRGRDAPAGARDRPGSHRRAEPSSIHDLCFFGPNGSLTPTGDLVIETRAWRERLFAAAGRVSATGYATFIASGERADPAHLSRVRDGRWHGRHGAQPAAGRDGRHRRATADAQVLHQPAQHVPRRDVHRPIEGRQAARCGCTRRGRARSRSTSSAPATCRSRCSTRRSPARAGWAATSGSARRPRTTGSTSSTSTWARSTTSPISTPTAAATSSRGSPTATRRR